MKRDNFGMRIDEIRELATKYSKPDLARMVQMGMLDPQKAVMAGMMIDRIAQSAMQPPQTTVAQDVLAQQPTTAQMPQQMPEGIMAAPSAPAASEGVAALPSGIREMAGGGIVAFADGGDIPGYADGNLVSASDVFRRGLATQPDGAIPPASPVPDAQSGLPVLPGGFKLREYGQMTTPTIQSEFEALREADRLAGVDTEKLFKTMRQEEAARRDELKARREEAKGEALVMAGLGVMGARQGEEFQTFSAVGRQAMQQYGSSLREIRDTERDIKKSERELLLAEDRFKRDQSSKSAERLEKKQTRYEELRNRSVDQYNDTVKSLAKMIADEKRVDQETATRMAIAELERRTRIDVETMQQRGAFARAGMGETSVLAERVLADLRKTNPNATLADAMAIVRGGAGASPASLADRAADNVAKRAQVDINFAMSLRDPNAYARAVEEETRRLQGQTSGAKPAPAAGGSAGVKFLGFEK